VRDVRVEPVRLRPGEEVIEEKVCVDNRQGVLGRGMSHSQNLRAEGRREVVEDIGIVDRDVVVIWDSPKVRKGRDEEVLDEKG
jgi:hypothetical protein